MIRLLPRATTAATGRSSWWATTRLWTEMQLARLLNRAGVPGAIQPMSYHDNLTGQQIDVRVGMLFTVLTVNEHDYYFDRMTGRFDGTGSGCTTCLDRRS